MKKLLVRYKSDRQTAVWWIHSLLNGGLTEDEGQAAVLSKTEADAVMADSRYLPNRPVWRIEAVPCPDSES
jgi:hypothetical protein